MIALDLYDKIRGDASAATKVDYLLQGIVNFKVIQLANGQLAASIGDLYTAALEETAVLSIILVNTDTVARTVNLYLTPSGGTARRMIPKDLSLGAGFSLVFNGQKTEILDTNGVLQISLSLTSLGVTATAAELNVLDGIPATLTFTELGYVDGVTSAIQTQMDLKAPLASPTFTGTVTIPTPFTLGAVSVTATGTVMNYLVGVTSAIQTQLDLKAPLASPTFTGTVTLPAVTLGDTVTGAGNTISGLATLSGTAATTSLVIAGHVTGGAPASRNISMQTGNGANPQVLASRMDFWSGGAQGATGIACMEPFLLHAKNTVHSLYNDSSASQPASAQIYSSADGVFDLATGAGNNAAPVKRISISNAATAAISFTSLTFGAITFNTGEAISRNVTNDYINIEGGDGVTGKGGLLQAVGSTNASNPGSVTFYTPNAAQSGNIERLRFSGVVATATATWADCYHVGLKFGLAGTATGAWTMDGATSGVVTMTVAAAAGTWTMTLPTSAGTSGYVLRTDGAGVCSWITLTTYAPLASPTFTGTVTIPTALISGLTASELVATDASKNLVSLAVATYPSLTELSYVKGVTSALQTQLNAKAGLITMVTTTDKSPTKDNNWYDVDLSTGDFVPSGTKAVQVLFTVPDADGNACIVGARKNGSADTATWNMGDSAVGNRAVFSMWCEVDANRILEILIQNSNGTAYINAYIL